MRCRARVGPPITHGRGEACGHVAVFIITAFAVGRPGVPVLVCFLLCTYLSHAVQRDFLFITTGFFILFDFKSRTADD